MNLTTPDASAHETFVKGHRPWEAIAAIAVLAGLYFSIVFSYLLFHGLVEVFSVTVAFGIFALAWNTRRFLPNDYLKVIGVGYLFCGFIDLLHTFAYEGMNVFTGYEPQLTMQLWNAARYVQAATMLGAAFFIQHRIGDRTLWVTCVATTSVLLVAIFSGHFPDCLIVGRGITLFKIVSEYVISGAFLVALILFYRQRCRFDPRVFRLIALSLALAIPSELMFTLMLTMHDRMHMIGHLLKLAEFYFMYKAIIVIGLNTPFELIFRDLKLTEQALLKSQAGLEEKVRERTEALDRLNRELEQRIAERTADLAAANKELEAFSYSVSHDLRAPLRHIDGYLGMLKERIATTLDEESRRYMTAISTAARRMGILIDDLLSFSRMGRAEMVKAKVNLGRLVHEVLQEFEPETKGRVIDWRIGELPVVSADRAMLRVVLVNLISNALKFTQPRERAEIEIGCMPDRETEIIVFVRDNGAGFDMRYVDKLFGVFQRLHGVEEFEGTGIGLANVRRVIDRHGGRTWADGKVDGGATFCFSLPKSSAAGQSI